MNRVWGLDVRITVELKGKTFRPQKVDGRLYQRPGEVYVENFPLHAIDGEMNPLNPPPPPAAEPGWEDDPFGERRGETPITFICEGPAALPAMWKIQQVMNTELPPSFILMHLQTTQEANELAEKIERRGDGLG